MARPRVLTVVLGLIHRLLVSTMPIFAPTVLPEHTRPVLEHHRLEHVSIVLLVLTLLQLAPLSLRLVIAVLLEHFRRPLVPHRLAHARTVLPVYTQQLLERMPLVLV